MHEGRPGHPPLLGAALRAPVLAAEPPGGLRELPPATPRGTLRVDVADPGVTLDADTPAHLERLAAAAGGEDLPDEARCLRLLAEAGASAALVAHARAVATVAAALTAALNARDRHLCVPLVHAAALLHDVARAEPHHDAAGAALLTRLGYPRVAPVVARHMRLGPADDVDEALVVYVADKLVKGDRAVGLEARFDAKLARVGGDVEARAAVLQRGAEARQARGLVERALGRRLDDVIRTA